MATTTNMGLILPDVSVTPGPTYASQNNAAFTLVDSHNHTPGNGALIPTAGISINTDLPFNDNAATELTRSAYTSQASALSGTNHTQVISNELHFIDGAGNNVKITNGGALDITSTGGIGGDYTAVGASITFTDATNTYLFRNGSSVESLLQFTDMINSGKQEWKTNAPAGDFVITDTDNRMVILVDSNASRSITLPDPTAGRRVVVVKDKVGLAATNNITVVRDGTEKIDDVAANKTLRTNFGIWWFISDLTDWWMIIEGREEKVSETVFDGTTTAGTTNLATSFASLTLTAPAQTTGDPVTRSGNTLTFPFTGKFRIKAVLPGVGGSGGGDKDGLMRLRNTTDTSTTAVGNSFVGNTDIVAQVSEMEADITDTSKGFEVQFAGQTTTSITNSAVDSENGPRFKIIIKYMGDT